MRQIANIIRRNKLYACLAIFILAINILVFAGWLSERSAQESMEQAVSEEAPPQPAGESGSSKIFDEEDILLRQKKIESLARTEPVLYLFIVAVNLTILFVIFSGFLIDAYLGIRFFRKEPVDIRLRKPEKPRWKFSDIVRVVLIFVSAGYIFVIFQSLAARQFTIFGNTNFRMVFDTALMNIVGIIVIFHFVRKKYSQDTSAIGFGRVDLLKGVTFGMVGYIALVPVLVGIMAATYFVVKKIGYEPPVQPIVDVFMKEKETSILWMSAVFAAIFGPVAEEIFFRGFMYPVVREKWGITAGIIGTSVIFSLLHAHIVGFLPIMALGVLLAYLYEKTGSLIVPMAVHMAHNLGMVVLVFLMRSVGV
jgi:uncharacterized protein